MTSYEAGAAEKIPGVRVLRDADLLAVVASDPATARRAASLLAAEWAPEALTPEADWPAMFKKTAIEPVEQPRARYPALLVRGDVAAALGAAAKRKSSSYWLNPIAHVPLEPRAALAEWKDDVVTIRGGAQAPFMVRQEVAQALKVPASQVRIVTVDSGGAFGGKQRGECEVEAARLAARRRSRSRGLDAGGGIHVQLHASGRSRRVESGVDATGRLTAMRFANYNSGAAGITPPYEIPNHWIGFYRARAVRQGSYRSLAAVANASRANHALDELADELAIDRVEFRLKHIIDTRLREMIERTTRRGSAGARPAARMAAESG